MKYTYDPEADAVYLYLVDSIAPGAAKTQRLVPLELKGADVVVDFDEFGNALGVEFLGVSRLFSTDALAAIAARARRPGES